MCWDFIRFFTGYCCLQHGVFVPEVCARRLGAALVKPEREVESVGSLGGEGGGRRGPFLPDCSFIPASEARRGEVCRVKPRRFDKQAFPWLCCQHAGRQHSSFGTELLQ